MNDKIIPRQDWKFAPDLLFREVDDTYCEEDPVRAEEYELEELIELLDMAWFSADTDDEEE